MISNYKVFKLFEYTVNKVTTVIWKTEVYLCLQSASPLSDQPSGEADRESDYCRPGGVGRIQDSLQDTAPAQDGPDTGPLAGEHYTAMCRDEEHLQSY